MQISPSLALAALLSLLPLAASAQTDSEITAAARALFQDGMAAVERGDYPTAADRLRRSVALRDSPVVRTNLALALIELGRLVEASEHLRAAIDAVEPGTRIHGLASERLAAILPRLGRLRILVTGAVDGIEVRLDGEPVPPALVGVEQPADPGAHTITLHRGSDEILASERMEIRSGRTSFVALVAPPPPPREPAPGASPPVTEEPWFWVLLGVVVLGAGAGITAAIVVDEQSPVFIPGDSGLVHPALTVRW